MSKLRLKCVTYEQAIALEKVGYPQDKHDLGYVTEKCTDRFNVYHEKMLTENASKMVKKVSAPTLELVAKWLRDEKQIFISVIYEEFTNGSWSSSVESCSAEQNRFISNEKKGGYAFSTYEEALSAAIDYAISILSKI